jgi:hypothetical protein
MGNAPVIVVPVAWSADEGVRERPVRPYKAEVAGSRPAAPTGKSVFTVVVEGVTTLQYERGERRVEALSGCLRPATAVVEQDDVPIAHVVEDRVSLSVVRPGDES